MVSNMIKKILITAISFSIVGCAGMKFPEYAQVKLSQYYDECREFAMDVYKNNGFSKLGNTVILSMDDTKARAMVTGCVVAMGKNSFEDVKSDINSKGASFGFMSATCQNAACKVDTEQQMKAYNLGTFYAVNKKFPDQIKAKF